MLAISTISAALIIACLASNFSISVAVGASLARCVTDDDCVPQLQCLATTDLVALNQCTDQDPYCVCVPRDSLIKLFCDQTQDTCSKDETCIPIPDSLIEQIQPAFALAQIQLCMDTSQAKFVQNVSTCQDDSQCPDGGECVQVSDASSFCASSLRTEELLPELSPEISPEQFPEASEPGEPGTVESSFESPFESEQPDEAVCIAAKSLSHMNREQLLYAKHYRARVLCDRQGSCATPGHMVLYKDRPMMMSSYCSQVPCRFDIMPVNSPKYQRKLRIPSATGDLTFLAFAARHGTKTEETLLRTATRIGL
ncbi:hypothetical protein FGB62_25g144 [Gracilaria domingensis]|nr:hypothetical protein FGB62_25g144 [Gracilaria domingensis]